MADDRQEVFCQQFPITITITIDIGPIDKESLTEQVPYLSVVFLKSLFSKQKAFKGRWGKGCTNTTSPGKKPFAMGGAEQAAAWIVANVLALLFQLAFLDGHYVYVAWGEKRGAVCGAAGGNFVALRENRREQSCFIKRNGGIAKRSGGRGAIRRRDGSSGFPPLAALLCDFPIAAVAALLETSNNLP
jgi:hypothetical protein